MAKFPDRHVDIVELTENVIQGLLSNPLVYPNPPVSPAELTVDMAALIHAYDDSVAARAAAELATKAQNELLVVMVGKTKDNLRYAEITVDYDDDLLKLLGWSGRANPKPLEAPGQCADFGSTTEGDDWIEFAWKASDDGGKPAMYKIMHRDNGTSKWSVANTAFETTFRLENVEAGKKIDYCVIAANKAGESTESNIVTAVL